MAYRNGAADFAALYVAEAAGLATREAVIEAAPPSRRHACAVERARARRNAERPGCD
jgi:hypothetical protein